jgi:hypothetical protein
VVTGYSVGSPTSSPHSAKDERPDLGTRRPGQAGEQDEEEGERHLGTRASG